MNITVDVALQEYVLKFQKDVASNGEGQSWFGSIYGVSNEEVWVRFIEKSGRMLSIKVSDNITTNPAVLRARLEEAYRQFIDEMLSDIEPDSELEGNDTDVPTPYDPEKIKVRRDIYSIREIFESMKEDAIDLNPEFQRYFVWNNTQKSQLIESLLLGLPIPIFYFAETKENTFNVIDGLQRLTTIRQYMQNEFPLKGLEYLKDKYTGRYFKTDEGNNISEDRALPRAMSRQIEKTQLVVNVIEASSPIQVKFDIFKRINTGGSHLNNQEIRNCIAGKSTRTLLRNMVHTELFREATGNSISDKRMDDQELALRFIGFYLVQKKMMEYSGNMTVFLDRLVEHLNDMKEKDFQVFSKAFNTALLNCKYLFGKYAFRKCLPEDLKPGAKMLSFNKSLFTTWTVSLCDRDIRPFIDEMSFAKIHAEELVKKDEFYNNVTNKTNDRLVIEQVFKKIESIVQNNLSKTAVLQS
jgi:uncharacterized protein with ParB-like and HNH nuclease domain